MTVTATEPEWDADERAKMVELARMERNVHPQCGHPLEDVLDPDAEGDPTKRRKPRYFTPEIPKVCAACAVRLDVIEADRVKYPNRPHREAMMWPSYDLGIDR